MAFVTEPSNQVIVHAVDFAGKHASETFYVDGAETDPDAGGPAALAAAVQGITTGLVYAVEVLIHATQTAAITPTSGPYDRVQDKAELVFYAADGSQPVMQVPAPNETIFGTNAVDVDRADAAVIALIAAMVTYGKTAEGQAIVGLQRGFRRRPPRLKHQ